MPGGSARSALIVSRAGGRVARPPRPAPQDRGLADLLGDRVAGGFEISVMSEPTGAALRLELVRFLADRAPQDTVVVHLAGRVVVDAGGAAYLCDATADAAEVTDDALPIDFLEAELARCRSERLAVLLDCSSDEPDPSRGPVSRHPVRGLQERFQRLGCSVHLVSTATVIDLLRQDQAILAPAAGRSARGPTSWSVVAWAALTAVMLVASVVVVGVLGPAGVALSVFGLAALSWPIGRLVVHEWRRRPAVEPVIGQGVPFHRLYMLRRSQKSADYFRHHGPGR